MRAAAKMVCFTTTSSIYDQADSQRLMTLVCRDLDLDPKRFPARSMSNQVSDLKNELVDWETARDQAENVLQKQVAEVYATYQARLREANAMDFDDLIMTTVNLLQAFPDVAEHYPAAIVAGEVDRLLHEHGIKHSDVAVFYRTNAQSRVFEEVFVRVGLPYRVVGGVRFYERKEVRDALAYLRVLANPADTVSLRRILNTPRRGIGDRAEACIEAFASRERITFAQALQRCEEVPGMATRSAKNVQEFADLMDELRTLVDGNMPPAEVLEAVLDRTGYVAGLAARADPHAGAR